MTLKEIASRAGVSVSTVSRVLNSSDDSFGSREVRERIWKLVKETGYVPNKSARSLRMGESHTESSGVISCIFGRTKTPADNPFFAQIARAIEQQALQMGYVVNSSYSIFDLKDTNILKTITTMKTDGAIVLGMFGAETRTLLERIYKNIVYTGLNSVDAQWDQVNCDGYQVGLTAMNHLLDLGHTRVAYVGETKNEIRFSAYKDALEQRGLPLDMSLVSNCPLDGASGYVGAEKLLQQSSPGPTAIFCGNDITALAVLRKLAELKKKVPADISVIGVDNIELSEYISPMLTTVGVPKEEMGQMAVRILIDRINKQHRLPMRVVLPHKLVIRESTAKPKK